MSIPPPRTARSRRTVVLAALTVAALLPAGIATAAPNPDAPGQQKKAADEQPADDSGDEPVSTLGLSWL